ncbi:MAG: sensor histidine kinase [Chitinophagaceae bacterium]|nr:MAG: sensor histidine kinase [Chitinophagaceae bacterium]
MQKINFFNPRARLMRISCKSGLFCLGDTLIQSMNTYPVPANEEQRLKELYAYNILDTEAEQDFTDIVELASYICDAPMSLISLIDRNRQWFKARKGISDQEMSRQIAICAHTIAGTGPFIVPDASKDQRFQDFSTVTGDPYVRFYAGVPLVTPNGFNIGSLCVIDNKPRHLNEQQEKALTTLATQVIKLMDERANARRHQEVARLEKLQNTALERMMHTQRRILTILGHDARAPLYAINQMLKITGRTAVSNDDLKSNLELMSNQLGATLIMIEDLLSWGKNHLNSDSGLTLKNIPLQDIVNDVMELLKGNAELKNINLVNKVPVKMISPIPATMMNFIIRNLVNNAIKFTNSGSVSITAMEKDSIVEVVVIDTGIGMGPQQLEHLNRGVNRTASDAAMHDSGIGIIMIQEFMLQLGGDIHFTSKKGSGTAVSVRLPRKAALQLPDNLTLLN